LALVCLGMISLKAFLPQVSDILNTTPAALYERQRALVRLGLLYPLKGRGPGSGVPLSADGLAVLLISLAVTDNLSDMDERVRRVCDASPSLRSKCPYTRATNFRDALSVLLGSTDKAARLNWVSVHRADQSASFGYRLKTQLSSHFHSPRKPGFSWPAITTDAMIDDKPIKAIGLKLRNALSAASDIDDQEAK
jgi:hypothetical protein